jgi:HJR/Mrr/RecB family endonuclease
VRVGLDRCVFCGRKKRIFQSARSAYTRRGAERLVRRAVVKNAKETGDMTWRDAEVLVCDWMKRHGYRDANLTANGADGGVDVVARKAVAQVKHQNKPVGIAEIQRLYGIAQAARKRPLFFATARYSAAALQWASAHSVTCYRYRYPTFVKVGS